MRISRVLLLCLMFLGSDQVAGALSALWWYHNSAFYIGTNVNPYIGTNVNPSSISLPCATQVFVSKMQRMVHCKFGLAKLALNASL